MSTNSTPFIDILPYIEQQQVYQKYDRTQVAGAGWAPAWTVAPVNAWIENQPIATFIDPGMVLPNGAMAYSAFSSYAFNGGNRNAASGLYDGITIPERQGVVKVAWVTDGLSNTFLAGDNHWNMVGYTDLNGNASSGCTYYFLSTPSYSLGYSWAVTNGGMNPFGNNAGTTSFAANGIGIPIYSFKSSHSGGGMFAMADGSVQFVSYSISLPIFTALGSRAGNEVFTNAF